MADIKVTMLSHTNEPEKMITAAAKLCYAASEIEDLMSNLTEDKIQKFVSMLSDLGHESPFEHASFTFAIEGVSRITEQQLTRHRIASYSIQSGRYVTRDNAEFSVPPSIKKNSATANLYDKAMEQSKENYKNLRTRLIIQQILDDYNEEMAEVLKESGWNDDAIKFWQTPWEGPTCRECVDKFKAKYKSIYSTIEKKAAEDARYVFPNSLKTKIIVTMNVRSLWNFFTHRCCNRAQWEIRQLARLMLAECRKVAPLLFKNAGPACLLGLGCPENAMQCSELKGIIPTQKEIKELAKTLYKKKE